MGIIDTGGIVPEQDDNSLLPIGLLGTIFSSKGNISTSLNFTSYGRESFSIENLDKIMEEVIVSFDKTLLQKGYLKIDSVGLTCGIDPSVLFIGSHISVLKDNFLNGNISGTGLYMYQPCLRTHNLKILFDDTKIPKWGSYFPSVGAITQPGEIGNACEGALDYLIEGLGVPIKNILIRVSSRDIDLIEALENYKYEINLEIDTRPISYYTHKLGLEGIIGRNFNIALRHGNSSNFNDIGNIILIEDSDRTYTVEIALGVTTIISELYGLDNIFLCNRISKVIPSNEGLFIKLKDCIVSAVAIMREGETPIATNKGRVLRKYLRGLIYFRKKLNLSIENIINFVDEFEFHEFGSRGNVSGKVESYIRDYEADLKTKLNLSEEDKIIKSVLY